MTPAWPRGPVNKLHLAAKKGSIAQTEALLASGSIDINCGDPKGVTPLAHAALLHPGVVAVLLRAGANPNVPDDRGTTALHLSAMIGQLRSTQMLLSAGAHLEATNYNRCTPLHLVAEIGHVGVIRALLEAGAAVDSCSKFGETALYSTAYHGHVEATKELLRANANPKLGTVSTDGEMRAVRMPIDVAAQHGHEGVVHELLRLGVDECGARRGEALILACKRQHLGTMAVLRDGGVVDKGSALIFSAGSGCEKSVQFLLRQHWATGVHREAYVNFCDKAGSTPLHSTTAFTGSPRIARMLLDAGARPDSPDRGPFENATPLDVLVNLNMKYFVETRNIGEKRHRLEGLFRILSQVNAIFATSWLWPADARYLAGASEAAIETKSAPRTFKLSILRRTKGTDTRRMMWARFARYSDKAHGN